MRCGCSVAGPLLIRDGPGTVGPDRKAVGLLEIGDDTVTVQRSEPADCCYADSLCVAAPAASGAV